MIDWIQNWYKSQCDGNWEHNHGIKIESLDNPGWNVKIDFSYTEVEIDDISWKLYEKSESDWVGYSVSNNVFSSSGDPLKLYMILTIFKELIQGEKVDDKFVNPDNADL